jgi:DUF1680 family protein
MRDPLPLAIALAIAAHGLPGSTALRADVLLPGQRPVQVQPAAPPQARAFNPHDVRILDGPFKQGQDIAIGYLLSLKPDRFLANFRQEAGLEPKAQHYGGWESQGVSGHTGGHYLSACALAWAATGDTRLLDRVRYMVDELALCQQANGNGYVAAIPEGKRVYAEVAAGEIRSAGFDLNGCWVPNYTLHKLFAGLRDAYRLCDNAKALTVARGLADWMESTHANLSEEQMQQVLACEHGGINETFADLYADTGDQRYLELSRRFHHQAILDPLARGEDILPGKHANTQIPKLTGLATRYELAGDPADRAAADFFWERVVNHHSYVTGGHCDHEHFGQPDQLNDRLSAATTETCNVYNMLRLTRHVFGWNPTTQVSDFYERALLNHIRATQHPDGRVIYNLSLKPGHHKEYQSAYTGFTCCVGTGLENHVRYGDAIYFHDNAGLWVNLYLASELQWRDRAVVLRQQTSWPNGDSATIRIECKEPQAFALRLRRPHWAKEGLSIRVNGEPHAAQMASSGYAQVQRTWQSGDRVDIRFPMTLRTESMPDNPKRIAVFYGPTLLAADLGPVEDPTAQHADFVPVLLTQNRPATEWLKPSELRSLHFRTTGVGKPHDIRLVPFHRLHDRRYTVYLDVFTQADWEARQAEIRAEQERERRLADRTIDILRIGEMQPERDHNLQGEHTGAGEFGGRRWRHATDGGWFSFTMKVDPEQPNELLCTYWGSDGGNRTFDILVDDKRITTQTLQNNAPGTFFEVATPIPRELIQGRQHVTIRFQAHPDHWAGGLFGCRVLRSQDTRD